jgi:hypothetical protein
MNAVARVGVGFAKDGGRMHDNRFEPHSDRAHKTHWRGLAFAHFPKTPIIRAKCYGANPRDTHSIFPGGAMGSPVAQGVIWRVL